jgi:hypothetical protein
MNASWPSLRPGEFEIPSSDELLWRVIGPHALDGNKKPTQLMFSLSSEDGGCLSIARESVATPAAAVEHREQFKNTKQYGAWAVSVKEVVTVALRAIDDSALIPHDGPPGHGYVDQRCGPSDTRELKTWQRTVRLQLFLLAERRAAEGQQYLCEENN